MKMEKTAWEVYVVATVVATMKSKQANGDTVSPTNVTPGQYPPAACQMCGGWTSFGGMSQYANCKCFGVG